MAGKDPLDDLPMIHPREALVNEAENKIRAAVIEATKELTTGERLQVVTNALAGNIQGIARYAIRFERHGNEDKPGGWA